MNDIIKVIADYGLTSVLIAYLIYCNLKFNQSLLNELKDMNTKLLEVLERIDKK